MHDDSGQAPMTAGWHKALLWAGLLAAQTSLALGQTGELAPRGKLRVGMIAITVLGGIADPVARFMGDRLHLPFQPVVYPNPEAYAQSFGKDEWDIAIGPRALAPDDKADSTTDLWTINLVYVSAPGKDFADPSAVDKAGIRIGTIQGAPSDRILSRQIRSAEIVRIPLSPRIASDAAELLHAGKADVFGADSGVGYPVAQALPGARLVPGAFGTVRVAVALPKGRSAEVRAELEGLIAEAKRTGLIQKAIDANGLRGVSVAPE